jgi:hypothetical protein
MLLVQYHEQYNNINSKIDMISTIAWIVQYHEQYNTMNSIIDMNSTKYMNGTIAWTVQ